MHAHARTNAHTRCTQACDEGAADGADDDTDKPEGAAAAAEVGSGGEAAANGLYAEQWKRVQAARQDALRQAGMTQADFERTVEARRARGRQEAEAADQVCAVWPPLFRG